jgi:TonB family protein
MDDLRAQWRQRVAIAIGLLACAIASAGAQPAPAASQAASAAQSTAPSASDARRAQISDMRASPLLACLRKPPIYPAAALRSEQQGRTVFVFTVNDDGQPGDAVVSVSSGHAALDEAALQHYQRCRRAHARLQDSEPLPPGRYALPIVWRIE